MSSSGIKIVLWLVASTSVSHCELFVLYSLAVIHGTPFKPSVNSLLKSAGASFVLTYAANISCLLSEEGLCKTGQIRRGVNWSFLQCFVVTC